LAIAGANNNAVMLLFEIWRESFINDADFALAKSSFDKLNMHPYRTFTDKIALSKQLAEMPIGKSYVNCQQDTALPHSHPWHPRLSERLGLFRLVECPAVMKCFSAIRPDWPRRFWKLGAIEARAAACPASPDPHQTMRPPPQTRTWPLM
jgi:hypothetical protein